MIIGHNDFPEDAFALPPMFLAGNRPDDGRPAIPEAASTAPQSPPTRRVRGTGRQAEPPRQQAPDDGRDQRAAQHRHGGHLRVHQAGSDGGGDGGAEKGADQIGHRREHHGLARREHFGGDDGGDGIGRVVKAVDVGEHKNFTKQQANKELAFWNGG